MTNEKIIEHLKESERLLASRNSVASGERGLMVALAGVHAQLATAYATAAHLELAEPPRNVQIIRPDVTAEEIARLSGELEEEAPGIVDTAERLWFARDRAGKFLGLDGRRLYGTSAEWEAFATAADQANRPLPQIAEREVVNAEVLMSLTPRPTRLRPATITERK